MSPHSETSSHSKTAKRPASAQLTSDNGKKQRGRPRVASTPEDGTAADRRRTQIRLAQRAYRQRKETTIASCKHQVLQLQKVIEDMNVIFTNFNSEAFKSGLASFNFNLTKELEVVAEKMNTLVRKAEDVVGEDMREDNSPELRSAGKSVEFENNTIPTTTVNWNEIAPNTKRSSSDSSNTTPPTVWGYSVTYEPEAKSDLPSSLLSQTDEKNNTTAVIFDHSLMKSNVSQEFSHHNFSTQAELFSQMTTQNFMTISLPSPITYSFNETTFARRLHRACLEDVYRLLCNPGASPDTVRKKFKFSLAHSSLTDIRDRIKIRLSRSNTETLDNPYQYKHCPNSLSDIRMNNTKVVQHVKANPTLGPQKPYVAAVESAEGQDGWFGPEDIQDFVESKGFFISATTSFAEGEIIGLVQRPYCDNAGVDASFLQSPPKTPDFLVKDVPLFHGYTTDIKTGLLDTTQALPTALTQQAGFQGTLTHSNSLGDLNIMGMYQRPALVRKRVLLDVIKFLGELVQACVCRGKTPKLRLEELERAFHVSAMPV